MGPKGADGKYAYAVVTDALRVDSFILFRSKEDWVKYKDQALSFAEDKAGLTFPFNKPILYGQKGC